MKLNYAEYNMYRNNIDVTIFNDISYGLTVMWQKMDLGQFLVLNVPEILWE